LGRLYDAALPLQHIARCSLFAVPCSPFAVRRSLFADSGTT
jgi:hypothetical protein